MIAAVVFCVRPALDPGQRIGQQRSSAQSGARVHAVPFIGQGAGEARRYGALVLAEDIDRKGIDRLPGGKGLRLAPDAEQDQRRIQRDRAERAYGRAEISTAIAVTTS